ncbi:N-acetyltransferase [Faecalibaculum rodentium]|nr:acyltransferase [Faecalibaculum rodentium]
MQEYISNKAKIGSNVFIGLNTIIEADVEIGDNCRIEENVIIRSGTHLGKHSTVCANSIIGEHTMGFYKGEPEEPLYIGSDSLIRSGSIIYTGSRIGDYFQTGHQVTIREKSRIGSYVSVGTLSDIQGDCKIGEYVRLHSNVHIGQKSVIKPYVWIFPYVVLTNDPTPPSEELVGVVIESFAIIATGAILLPGIHVDEDCLIAAGAIVTKDVHKYEVVGGNPAKVISDVRKIKNHVTGESAYPWKYHFERNMPWESIGYRDWELNNQFRTE